MKQTARIALVAVTKRGYERACLLRSRLRTGDVHRSARYGPALDSWDHTFDTALAERTPEWFASYDQIVYFLAVGAVTRLLAPCLHSKTSDPGVLAVDEVGQFVVPVLSGHQGGANAFARTVAGYLGAIPVVTTASDVIGGLSLDLLEDALGWTAQPVESLKPAARALVDGEPVAIVQEIGCRSSWLNEMELPGNITWVRDVRALPKQEYASILWVTDRLVVDLHGVTESSILWYRPKSLVLGVGCERGIAPEALARGLDCFMQEHRYALTSIATIASVDIKADEAAISQIAERHGWKSEYFTAPELASVAEMPNPSQVVDKCVGTPGVAEPAALLASRAARLLVEKQIVCVSGSTQRMTFALARGEGYQVATVGKGKVIFIGAGPGDPDLLTAKAYRHLRQAEVAVYAGSLVPTAILNSLPRSAVVHDSSVLVLEQVVEIMIDAARVGKQVVRLHSGDTSIYSAIQEQMTLLDAAGIDYEVIPGISSFQAAAAALKAELTLPDTVQTIILTRAAGATKMPKGEDLADLARHGATLCIFLSARLAKRVESQLLSAYPADTPVAIAYRVSWPDEKIVVTELCQLNAEMQRHHFRRTTLILVGQAIARRENRSKLYDASHAHIFRARPRES